MIDISNSNISLQEAINNLKPHDTLYIGNRTFLEKIVVSTPNITILGEDASIIYNAYHSKIIPISEGGDGIKKYGTTGSATFTVLESADNFKASGIKFYNSHERIDGESNQAVAFKSSASNIVLESSIFISHQDTLYIDLGKNNKVNNCYICGDVDFIFGSAECLFTNCAIEAIGNGYIIAPNTYVGNQGFKFKKCMFKTKENLKVYLGRPWYPSGAIKPVYPKAIFKDSYISDQIELDFIKMHEQDPFKYDLIIDNCFYRERVISKNLSRS